MTRQGLLRDLKNALHYALLTFVLCVLCLHEA